ncbi:HAMP domain-containing histidine kinase [Myxococcaceae bacterium JPH2]|nr:HAMP domain-containing histidine kinase [Myxococcaceae bacterium JPH2]
MDTARQRDFNEIQLRHFSRVFGRMVRVRLHIGKLLLTATAMAAVLDPALWRRVAVGMLVAGAVGLSVFELWRFGRRGLTASSMPSNLWGSLVFQVGFIVCTGGIASPLLPALLPLSFVSGIVLKDDARRMILAANTFALSALAWLQLSGVLPGLPLSFLGSAPPAFLLVGVIVVAVLGVIANRAGALIRVAFDNMLEDALDHRDELLAVHRNHARELEALSGEIAHELKNPLATVKGLTQLMAREPGRPQPSERLRVLSSEVARMQGILDEFLNFSRPLVPLSVSAIDLAELCDEALVLHEGLASEHAVRLLREGSGPVLARCDSRKVKQVMMNLLHNAIEASPPGAHVVMRVGTTDTGDARVAVVDEGSGIAPELGERVFEAGVTSKARGSGLGLTVARALARQHGGELRLENGRPSGCVAELVLPRELPEGALGTGGEARAHV